MPNNEPSSEQRDNILSRFKKWFREKYPCVYRFFFSETPIYIRHFFGLLVSLGILGGFLALTVPLWESWDFLPFLEPLIPTASTDYSKPKAIADLRLHILYITGGIIAILTLLQTNWKNQIDRRKVEDDIQKNKNDHDRQVHAERRSRYTAAVGQLADEKAAIRLGGIYTLVGLVDEWLADSTLSEEEQQKEGQVIINNLCSYIRSPFPLAEKIDEYEARTELKELDSKNPATLLPHESRRLDTLRKRFEDSAEYQEPDSIASLQAAFHEEQDVRRAIFEEMSKRSSKVSVDKSKEATVTPGAWSCFKFDFSRAPIFYPLNNLIIEQGQFTSARFYSGADFLGAKFIRDAYFTDVEFSGNADFWGEKFAGNVDFESAGLIGDAHFVGAGFAGDAHFVGAGFIGKAYFVDAEFTGDADFGDAKFSRNANFSNAEFTGDADFGKAKFTGNAYFSNVEFSGNAHFREAKFTGNADFRSAEFSGNAQFWGTDFTGNADFTDVKFTSNTGFKGVYFEKYAPIFAYDSGSARFSDQVNWTENNFSVRSGSKPIELGSATLGDKTVSIPFGTVVFDPDSWDGKTMEYTHMSVTCCRIQRSPQHQE